MQGKMWRTKKKKGIVSSAIWPKQGETDRTGPALFQLEIGTTCTGWKGLEISAVFWILKQNVEMYISNKLPPFLRHQPSLQIWKHTEISYQSFMHLFKYKNYSEILRFQDNPNSMSEVQTCNNPSMPWVSWVWTSMIVHLIEPNLSFSGNCNSK